MQFQLNGNLEIHSQYSQNEGNLRKDDDLKNEVNLKINLTKWKQPKNRRQPQKLSQSENEDNSAFHRKWNC